MFVWLLASFFLCRMTTPTHLLLFDQWHNSTKHQSYSSTMRASPRINSSNSLGLLVAATTTWIWFHCLLLLSTPALGLTSITPARRVMMTTTTTTKVARFSTSGIPHAHSRQFMTTQQYLSNGDNDESSVPKKSETTGNDPIDLSVDDRLYRIRLPRAAGIEWGTDLSFSFVYVRALEPAGPASLSGLVNKGDQLCELVAVDPDKAESKVENLMGASFDYVMGAFAGLGKTVKDVDLVFFRGTKEELKEAANKANGGQGGASGAADTITVTVIQNKGSKEEQVRTLTAKPGVNIRELLIDNGINVYQSVTRWTNCKGKQLCGTCIVNVTDGAPNTNRKSMDEESTLRENPGSYRISCVSFAYGDITVETFPPIEAAQWTR